MARPKEFDLERALYRAISAFSQKGFAATSTDELMRAMEVGRQSMYDTFGDKRALFLKALEVYVSENVRAINVELRAPEPRVNPCFYPEGTHPLCRAQRSFQYRWLHGY